MENNELYGKWQQIQVQHPEANFLQSPNWGRVNELMGHKVVIEKSKGAWCLMIIKSAKRGRYLEIPGGPLIDWTDETAVRDMFERIKVVARQEKCAFVRLRPQLRMSESNLALLERQGCQKAPMHLHAEHTVMIDLEKSESELLADMRRQTRYEVRKADKLGLQVEWGTSEELFRDFHRIQLDTATRQHFVPPDLKMLLAERTGFLNEADDKTDNESANPAKTSVTDDESANPAKTSVTDNESTNPNNVSTTDNASTNPDNASATDKTSTTPVNSGIRIYTVKTSDGQLICYGLIIINGAEAEYFEAASTRLGREFPGAYALLWRAMRDLKAMGVKRFNLWGIAPEGQPNHRYAGVTTFKKGFGGEVVEFVPAQDIVIKKSRYLLNLAVETIRKKRRHL